jgi:tRNA-specific 2-thiouridylase
MVTKTFLDGTKLRVAVAMSGGVDSSVAAALVASSGVNAIGLTLRLYDAPLAARPGACCAGIDIADAKRVADRLGIAHYVIDRQSRFREAVIDQFADDYLRGQTPIPCVRCNQTVKFSDLIEIARDLGAEYLVTGHYARRVEGPGGPELHHACDATRDQSYFLFATTGAQLDYIRFPLGDLPKAEVRAMATRFGLAVANKPDSQDICFVQGGRYADLVRKLRPEADAPGEIVDQRGRVLGTHAGLIDFTVGQRRGLGIGGETDPLYVLRLEPATRRVVVGPRAALGVDGVMLGETNWISGLPAAGTKVEARVRSASRPVAARVVSAREIAFDVPESGVSPGQACVVSQGSRVLGGGFIAHSYVREEPLAA